MWVYDGYQRTLKKVVQKNIFGTLKTNGKEINKKGKGEMRNHFIDRLRVNEFLWERFEVTQSNKYFDYFIHSQTKNFNSFSNINSTQLSLL